MGVSTDAILFYGFVWEDEAELIDGVDGEWEEVIAKQRGLADPWVNHPGGRRPDWVEEHRAEIDSWREAKKAIASEYGVEIDSHGSDAWSVPIVKIAGAGHTAARGYPHRLTAENLAVGEDWDAKLQRFISDLGIDASEALGPGWFMASWWG